MKNWEADTTSTARNFSTQFLADDWENDRRSKGVLRSLHGITGQDVQFSYKMISPFKNVFMLSGDVIVGLRLSSGNPL